MFIYMKIIVSLFLALLLPAARAEPQGKEAQPTDRELSPMAAIERAEIGTTSRFRRLVRTANAITVASFSPDSSIVALGGERANRLSPERERIPGVVVGPSAWIIEASGEYREQSFDNLGYVNSIMFSSDGSRVVFGGFDTVTKILENSPNIPRDLRLRQEEEPKLPMVFSGPEPARGVSIVHDVASGRAIAWLVSDQNVGVVAVGLSGRGDEVTTFDANEVITRWDVATSKTVFTRKADPKFYLLGRTSFAGGGSLLAYPTSRSADDLGLLVRDLDADRRVGIDVLAQLYSASLIHFTPDGKRVYVASLKAKTSPLINAIAAYETRSGTLLRIATMDREHDDSNVTTLAFSQDGRRLAIGNHDGSLQIWDANLEQLRRTIKGPKSAVRAVAFAGGKIRVLSGGLMRGVWVPAEKPGGNRKFKEFGIDPVDLWEFDDPEPPR